MSTFHALCLRILRAGIDRLGYKNNFSIYDEGDQLGLIKKIITRTAARDEKLDPNVAKSLISKAKNNGWTPPDDEETLLGAVFARYQARIEDAERGRFRRPAAVDREAAERARGRAPTVARAVSLSDGR